MICSICKKDFSGYGNNAHPVAEGDCCDNCNISAVIPARLGLALSWYYLDGVPYCRGCVESDTPCMSQLEASRAVRGPAAQRCACCGGCS
jgi:hypothetical protein